MRKKKRKSNVQRNNEHKKSIDTQLKMSRTISSTSSIEL